MAFRSIGRHVVAAWLALVAASCGETNGGAGDEMNGAGGSAIASTGSGGAAPPAAGTGGVMMNSGAQTAGTGGTPGTSSAGTGGMIGSGGASGGTGGASNHDSTMDAGRDAGTNGSGGAGSAGGDAMACAPMPALAPGETNDSIEVGGTMRTYVLHVPNSYAGTSPVPLVLDFHPIFGSGSGERDTSGYAALSDQEGFIVAFPDGIDAAWNVGPCCTMSRSVDDVAFAKALVEKLKASACIDPKRVYATGFSMGGGMSHYLGCHAADVFATVVPASFDLLMENEADCQPARPITVMAFRGTADMVVPYAGGASDPPNGLPTIHFLGAKGTFEKWAMLDGCTGSPAMQSNGCQTYAQCNMGVEVTLCTIDGGGHQPGDAMQGWAMMKKHPMP